MEANEPRMPKRKTKGTQEPVSKKTSGHTKPLGERVNDWLKKGLTRLSHYSRNNRIIW